MNFYARLLAKKGWRIAITAPYREKCVICVAPHTSNWDFIIGLTAYKAIGRKASFLMKSFWFFFPLGILMRKLGGIAVKRSRNTSLTERLTEDFKNATKLNLAITPEGTRSGVSEWKTGFLRIACNAGVPIQLGIIDYSSKTIIIDKEFYPSGDMAADMKMIKDFYSNYKHAARYPDKFMID